MKGTRLRQICPYDDVRMQSYFLHHHLPHAASLHSHPRLSMQARRTEAASSEFEKLGSDVRSRTMEAVDSLGAQFTRQRSNLVIGTVTTFNSLTMRSSMSAGRTCTVGDLASRAGLKTTDAEVALQALAADTGATIKARRALHALPTVLRPIPLPQQLPIPSFPPGDWFSVRVLPVQRCPKRVRSPTFSRRGSAAPSLASP